MVVRAQDVRPLQDGLQDLLRALDPSAVPVFDALGLWEAFDRVERVASAAKTLLARRVEEACTFRRDGYRSAAEQLAGVSGGSVAAAKGMLETSKQVVELPATAAAVRAGGLSAAKVEAIAAAATIAPDAEARLLDDAERLPLAALRDKCLRARAVDRDAAYARIRRDRGAREYIDAEGAWNFYARGTLEAGAMFRAAHGPIVDEMFKAARAEGRREPYEAYAFDAFVELARRASRDAQTDPGAESTAKAKRSSSKLCGLIRIDHEALRRGAVEGDEVCEIAGLGPIPVPVARDLLGDAVLKLVITKGVDVASVTHLGRSATVAQQVALWWRSPCCSIDDCTRTQRLQNDHGPDWAVTHHTRLGELKPLCDHHHHLKTHSGWDLTPGPGPCTLVPPHDPRHPKPRPPPDHG